MYLYACNSYCRKRKHEQDIIRMTWKFKLQDLQIIHSKARGVVHLYLVVKKRKNNLSFTFQHSIQSLSSPTKSGPDGISLPSVTQSDVTGFLKGEVVTIVRYKKLVAIRLNREELLNLKMV